MKKIYIVTGSEDGVLDAATNIKAAYRIAMAYSDHDQAILLSYSQVVRELKKYNEVETCSEYMAYATATIRAVTLYTK